MKRIIALLVALSCFLLTGCVCAHEQWIEASCEQPKVCTACGLTEGAPLGHIWSPATIETPKTCTTCGKTEGSSLLEELYPLDQSRSTATEFLFAIDEFPALLNRELEGTGYTVKITEENENAAYYNLLQDSESEATIRCHLSYNEKTFPGEAMVLFVHMDCDESTSQEQQRIHEEIMSAVFRTVYIPAYETTYDQLLQGITYTTTGFDNFPISMGRIAHIGYSITHRSDMTTFMIILESP